MPCGTVRLCGISSHFWLLSPCIWQVTHALLTRPPLSYPKIWPKSRQRVNSVRLACVKHAASVHPAPGSNSLKKSFWSGSKQAWLLFIRYCLGCICSILSEYSRKLKASPFAHVRFHNAPHCLHPVICHLPGKPDMSSDSLRSASRSETFSREFSGLHYCLFVKVLCLAFVSYQTRNVVILS